jgi:hypothetical protein
MATPEGMRERVLYRRARCVTVLWTQVARRSTAEEVHTR